jgi:hypothetical protein
VVLLVIAGIPSVTDSVNVAVPVPPALVAPREMVELPAAVGVPEMSPDAVLMVNPAGSPEALKLVGVLLPVIW